MSKKDQAATWLRSVVAKHLPANARKYSWATYTGEVQHGMLGVGYLSPAQGKVVDASDEWLLVRTERSEFTIVDKSLLCIQPEVGATVELEFYRPRRFLDHTLADGGEDPAVDGCQRFVIGRTTTYLPAKWEGRYLGIDEHRADRYQEIQNPYLRDLIEQLEKMSVDGGMRFASNVLVDAGVRTVEFVDPPEENVDIQPAIRFSVANKAFTGEVEINYDRGLDYYRVIKTVPYPSLNTMERIVHEEIDFLQLPDLLKEILDDGEWRKVQVTILKPAPRTRGVPA